MVVNGRSVVGGHPCEGAERRVNRTRMTIVFPLLLGGLILAGLPVLIHLLRRQKPKRLPFPALRLLRESFQANQRSLRLRQLLLLVLRMAIVALICFAVSRPLLDTQWIASLPGSADRPVAAVFLFDTSYSMEYQHDGRSRLRAAQDYACRLLDDLPPGSRVAVLDSAELGGEWQVSLSKARDRIARLRLRPANFPVTRQLKQAYRLLVDDKRLHAADGQHQIEPALMLFIFSDRTQPSWQGKSRIDLPMLPSIRTWYVDFGVDRPRDIAITNVELTRPVTPAENQADMKVTVRGSEEKGDVEVIGAIYPAAASANKPWAVGKVTATLPDSTVHCILDAARNFPPGYYHVEVKLQKADALPFNDVRYATFEVRSRRKVLLVADRAGDARPWQIALEETGAWHCDIKSSEQMHDVTPEEMLATYRSVCLLNVAQPNVELWEKLADFVLRGGGLAVIPGGEELVKDAYQQPAAQKVLPAQMGRIVSSAGLEWALEGKQNRYNYATPRRQHPLLRMLDTYRTSEVDFEQPHLRPKARRYWEVKPWFGATPVVGYADTESPPALVERVLGKGRVLLFTTALDGSRLGPDQRWNNYWHESSFGVVLANLTVGYLAGDAEPETHNYTAGEIVPVRVPAAPFSPLYTLVGPGLPATGVAIPGTQGENRLRIHQAVTPGNYTLLRSDGTPVGGFSVNVAAEESQLTRLPISAMEDVIGPDSVRSADDGIDMMAVASPTQTVELLPWLMMLVLFLLAGESLLANRFYPRARRESER